MQMRIGTKIAAGFAAMLVLLGFMAAIALYSLYAAESQVSALHQTNRRLMIAMKLFTTTTATTKLTALPIRIHWPMPGSISAPCL